MLLLLLLLPLSRALSHSFRCSNMFQNLHSNWRVKNVPIYIPTSSMEQQTQLWIANIIGGQYYTIGLGGGDSANERQREVTLSLSLSSFSFHAWHLLNSWNMRKYFLILFMHIESYCIAHHIIYIREERGSYYLNMQNDDITSDVPCKHSVTKKFHFADKVFNSK